jgi:hypothetical protein
MALILADRVKDTSTTTGTGTLTLANSAPAGFQTFGSVMADGDVCWYALVDSSGAWETGIGTYTASGTHLSRDTVFSSSNANALVNIAAGTTTVFLTMPAKQAMTQGVAVATALGWAGN